MQDLHRICQVIKGTKSIIADGLSAEEASRRVDAMNEEMIRVRAYFLYEQDKKEDRVEQSPQEYWGRAEDTQDRFTRFFSENSEETSRVAAKRS